MKRHILYKELALISRLNHEQSETIKDFRQDIMSRDSILREMQDNTRTARSRVTELANDLKDANAVLTKYKGEFTQQVERIQELEQTERKQYLDLDACHINAREIMSRVRNAKERIKLLESEHDKKQERIQELEEDNECLEDRNEELQERIQELEEEGAKQAKQAKQPLPKPKPHANMKHIGDEI